MPKLLVITTSYPLRPASANGVFVRRYLDELPSGWDITVLTPDDTSVDQPEINRIQIIPVRYAPKNMQCLANVPGGIMPAIKRNPFLLLFVPSMIITLVITAVRESRRHDLIHANWAICGFIARISKLITGIPYVTTLRGDDANRASKSLFFRWLLRQGTVGADAVTAVSEDILKQVVGIFPEITSRSVLIANGINNVFLSVGESRISSRRQPEELRLLTISHLIPRKAIDVIIRACHLLAQQGVRFALTVGGDGSELEHLISLAEELKISSRVSFVGHIDPENVPLVMSQNDIFILSSRSEGRANVVLEAMAAGMAIVATDIPGTKELIRNDATGILFPVDDHVALSEILVCLANNPDQQRSLGMSAMKAIHDKGLLWSNTALSYDRLFTKIASGPES